MMNRDEDVKFETYNEEIEKTISNIRSNVDVIYEKSKKSKLEGFFIGCGVGICGAIIGKFITDKFNNKNDISL